MPRVRSEKGSFLNEKQKKIKQEMMESIMSAFYDTPQKYRDEFDDQSGFDLMLSCLIMASRELIIILLLNSNAMSFKKDFMRSIFQSIEGEVERRLKEEMQ